MYSKITSWAPLKVIKEINLDQYGTAVIRYIDDTYRKIPYAQHLYEQEIGRMLMTHEVIIQKDGNFQNYLLDNLILYIRHPDWPENNEHPLPASKLREYKSVSKLSLAKRDGRYHIEIRYKDGSIRNCPYARFLMEIQLGRYLTKYENVDHIDENRINNEITNLQILSSKCNTLKSHIHRNSNIGDAIFGEHICLECGKIFKRLKVYVKNKDYIFCSRSCHSSYKIRKHYADNNLVKYVTLKCEHCHSMFKRLRTEHDRNVRKDVKRYYCSDTCRKTK